MPEWVNTLVIVLGSVGGSVGYMTTIMKPMKAKLDDMIAKEIEKEKEQQRWQKIEGWTENQQKDLDNLNEGVVILAGSVSALLDHTIQKQDGNGKCHKAQAEVDTFLREKAMSKKSHH